MMCIALMHVSTQPTCCVLAVLSAMRGSEVKRDKFERGAKRPLSIENSAHSKNAAMANYVLMFIFISDRGCVRVMRAVHSTNA